MNNSDKLWNMLVASNSTVTIPVAELLKLEASATTKPQTPAIFEFKCDSCGETFTAGTTKCSDCGGNINPIEPEWTCSLCDRVNAGTTQTCECLIAMSEEDLSPERCISWVQYLINYRHQQSTGGKGLSAHVWRFAVSSAFANHPLPGADGKWFQATIESGLERLDDSSPYPNAANLHQTRLIHGMVIKVDLEKALGIMRAYYAYHSEDNGIGPLMMAAGTVVEDAVLNLKNDLGSAAYTDDDRKVLAGLAAVVAQCKVWKKAALATGIPAVVPRGPVTGTGTGASLPERRNKQAKDDAARNMLWDMLEAKGATVYLTDNAEWTGRNIMCTGCGHINKVECVIKRHGLESWCCTNCGTPIIATNTDMAKLRGALGVTFKEQEEA